MRRVILFLFVTLGVLGSGLFAAGGVFGAGTPGGAGRAGAPPSLGLLTDTPTTIPSDTLTSVPTTTATSSPTAFPTVTPTVCLITFADVPPGNTFYADIQCLACRGIIGGYPCGGAGEPCTPPGNRPYFRPGNNSTRGQTAKIVTQAFFSTLRAAKR